jgi:hypothetical protein
MQSYIGPFSWNNASIEIITESPDQFGQIHRRVVDEKAGFDLLCSDVAIARGPAAVPDNPFNPFRGRTEFPLASRREQTCRAESLSSRTRGNELREFPQEIQIVIPQPLP